MMISDKERYINAAHAVQSGVAMEMNYSSEARRVGQECRSLGSAHA